MKKIGRAVSFLSLMIRHNNRERLKAAKLLGLLGEAKNRLLYARGDFGGGREIALQHINIASDEIRMSEKNKDVYRYDS
jgi:hypothetical protein